MKHFKKHGFNTGKRIRKNPRGSGYIISNTSLPYCTKCNTHGCRAIIYEKYTHILHSTKSLKKSKIIGRGTKWARKTF